MKPVQIPVSNPFDAPVFYIDDTESTMKEARLLAEAGYGDGTVIHAGYQNSGRGRLDGRIWESPRGQNLLCTVLLRRNPVSGFTLRAGLAVARTFDALLSGTGRSTEIKWPNDVLCGGKKLAGILCESDGPLLYVGTGFNIGQSAFPEQIAHKASSLALLLAEQGHTACEAALLPSLEEVLALYLENLHAVLELDDWHDRISEKLWMRGKTVRFLSGDPARKEEISGVVEGIGPSGELLLRTEKSPDQGTSLLRLFSGEFPYEQS